MPSPDSASDEIATSAADPEPSGGSDPQARESLGWVRRFVVAPDRLEEVVALYRRLGLEVRLEPPGPGDLEEMCDSCEAGAALFRVVYTRAPREDAGGGGS